MAVTTSGSALSVDFGSVNTRVVLIDVVDGVYRLVARGQSRTTDGFPVNDLTVGLDRVLRQLSETTGRKLLSETGQIIFPEQPDRSGVDTFTITASIGRPLRAVVAGLMPDMSIASALRAAAGTYIDVAATLSLGDGRSEEDRLNAIVLSAPDVVFLTGGTEHGAESSVLELAEVIRLAVILTDKRRRPTIIYAGNNALNAEIQKKFHGLTELFIAQNVRPELDDDHLDSARLQLAQAFDHYKETRSESFAVLSAMSQSGVLPTAQSYNTIVEYLGALYPRVLAVDVGSATSTLTVAYEGDLTARIRTDIGLGHSALTMLSRTGLDAVRRWLPFNAPDNELWNYVANKSLRPATIPTTLRDLYLEHALLKAGVRQMLADTRGAWGDPTGTAAFDIVIGAGAGLSNTGSPSFNALLLLDSVQPTGVTALQADTNGLIPALGALALSNPEAVVQLLDDQNIDWLGTSISPLGMPRQGKPAMKIRIKTEDGETYDQTVLGGQLWVYPLPGGQYADVRIRLGRGLTLNGKRRLRLKLTGGRAGLIFDARGRPLPLGLDVRTRAEQLPRWISEATGDPLIAIDERWLEEISTGMDEVTIQDEKKRGKKARPPKPDRKDKARRRREKRDDSADSRLMGELDEDAEDTEDQDELGDLRSVLS